MKYFLGIIVILTIFSCDATPDQTQIKTYYDLKGFIDNQIKVLNDTKPMVSKKLMVNGKKEDITAKISDWEKELELFKQLDINKPAFRTSYEVKELDTTDSTTIEYTLKPSEKASVKVLKIVLDKNKNLKTLWAKVQQENNLYHSDKMLSFLANKSTITSYKIVGFQQLKYFDKKPFEIEGKINQVTNYPITN